MNPPAQAELPFRPHTLGEPAVSERDTTWLQAALAGRGWVLASTLLAQAGMPATDNTKRWLRAVAHACAGQVASGPGTPGYARTVELRPEQIARLGAMRSQAREMLRQHIRILRVWHAAANRSPGA